MVRNRMTLDGAGVQQVEYVGGMPGGHVGSDWERGLARLQVFERQFPIDQFFT